MLIEKDFAILLEFGQVYYEHKDERSIRRNSNGVRIVSEPAANLLDGRAGVRIVSEPAANLLDGRAGVRIVSEPAANLLDGSCACHS